MYIETGEQLFRQLVTMSTFIVILLILDKIIDKYMGEGEKDE